jgi:glutamyl-tRNA synthetase
MFSIDELVNAFSVAQINKGGARFDYEKAKWFNQKYIQTTDPTALIHWIGPLAAAKGYRTDPDFLSQVIILLRDRVTFLADFVEQGYYLFEPVREYEMDNLQKKWTPAIRPLFNDLIDRWKTASFTAEALQETTHAFMEQNSLKPGDVMPLLRIALAGSMKGPAVFDTALVLGQAEACNRLQRLASLEINSPA